MLQKESQENVVLFTKKFENNVQFLQLDTRGKPTKLEQTGVKK